MAILYSFHAAFFRPGQFKISIKNQKNKKKIENQTIHGQILPDKLMWVLKCSFTL